MILLVVLFCLFWMNLLGDFVLYLQTMSRNNTKQYNFPFLMVVFLFVISSCKNSEKDNLPFTETATDIVRAQFDFLSLFEIADDFITQPDLFSGGNKNILTPQTEIVFIDDTFFDGDGVEYLLDFGPVSSNGLVGIKGNDGLYRAGKLKITLSDYYHLVGAVVTVEPYDNGTFLIGNGKQMSALQFKLSYRKTGTTSFVMDLLNGSCKYEKGNVKLTGSWTLTKTNDPEPGFMRDEYTISANANGNGRNGQVFEYSTLQDMSRVVNQHCSGLYTTGKLNLKIETNKSTCMVDFDPFNNKACDNTFKAIINNNEFFLTHR